MAFVNLETDRLIIRKWLDRDRELFHRINSDDRVMRFFPFRRSRKEADALMDLLNRLIEETGFSFSALEIKTTGECIGFCGLHKMNIPQVFPDSGVEIGWRLAPQFWGKGYVTEAGFRLLEYGFNILNLEEIYSFAVQDNLPSLAVMKRLGMSARTDLDFDHPGVPDTYPDLKHHKVYMISKPGLYRQALMKKAARGRLFQCFIMIGTKPISLRCAARQSEYRHPCWRP